MFSFICLSLSPYACLHVFVSFLPVFFLFFSYHFPLAPSLSSHSLFYFFLICISAVNPFSIDCTLTVSSKKTIKTSREEASPASVNAAKILRRSWGKVPTRGQEWPHEGNKVSMGTGRVNRRRRRGRERRRRRRKWQKRHITVPSLTTGESLFVVSVRERIIVLCKYRKRVYVLLFRLFRRFRPIFHA